VFRYGRGIVRLSTQHLVARICVGATDGDGVCPEILMLNGKFGVVLSIRRCEVAKINILIFGIRGFVDALRVKKKHAIQIDLGGLTNEPR